MFLCRELWHIGISQARCLEIVEFDTLFFSVPKLNGFLCTISSVQLSTYDSAKSFLMKRGIPDGVPAHIGASAVAAALAITAMQVYLIQIFMFSAHPSKIKVAIAFVISDIIYLYSKL